MKWISVEDAKPEANEVVKVKWGRKQKVDKARYCVVSDGDFFWDNMVDCVYQSNEVTHWMRIEPPKVRKEGE